MEKINVAGLLKDCPKGMELDCTMYNKVFLLSVDDKEDTIFPIRVFREDGNSISLTKYGQFTNADFARCIIFPKGKTTWEGFVPPCKFKDGDVVVNASNEDSNAFIYAGENNNYYECYVGLVTGTNPELSTDKSAAWVSKKSGIRFATEEEKQKLFDAIKENGYKWNGETKTLEKLVPNKFDITTLIPFESRVLARNDEYNKWFPVVWGFYDKDEEWPYNCSGFYYVQCIPYEGNEHLLGKTDDCDEFYKTWEP